MIFKCCVLVLTASICIASSSVRLRIDSGCVCGSVREAESGVLYSSFRGIPYAQQPLGGLRFKELQPAAPWAGCLNATEDGPICPQYDELYGRMVDPQRGMSEACLLANVHVPQVPNNETLPILVFVHGGGFQAGSGNSDMHGPEYLMAKGVIVITFNYRLHVFGFLSLGTDKVPGNAGLRDILTLLRWVRRNARVFGGDPEEVTIAGQSAGSTLTHLITLATPAKGLFKRAILMSGTAITSYYSSSPDYARNISTKFLKLLGIDSNDPDDVHDQLIEMPLENIMEANRLMQAGLVSFVPLVEGIYQGVTRILDDDPVRLIKQGRGHDIPLIIGFTSAEAEFFKARLQNLDLLRRVNQNPSLLLNGRLANLVSTQRGTQLGKQVARRYGTNGRLTIDDLLQVFTESLFTYPAFKLAQWRSSMDGAPVYLYQFSFASTHNVVKQGLMLNYEGGGAHAEDLSLLFRNNALLGHHKSFPPRDRDDLMKFWITEFVVNYMRCGSPFCDKQTAWPPVESHRLNYQNIRDPVRIETHVSATNCERDIIRFFDAIEKSAGNLTTV